MYPIYIELFALVFEAVPVPIYLPADDPIATLPFHKVLFDKEYRPFAELLLPSVLNARAYAPFAVLLLPFVFQLRAAYPFAAL